MARKLQGWAQFIVRQVFDEDSLDPMNAPALVQELEKLKGEFRRYADDPEGLEKHFFEYVQELRVQFQNKKPSLRVRYAIALPPITDNKE